MAQCLPADTTPAPTNVAFNNSGTPATGKYAVAVQKDSLTRHTVYRPALNMTAPIPIVSWGNGGCSANGTSHAEFLAEIASHGYLVIANGDPNGSGSDPDNGSTHISAIDWATKENSRPCSQYYNKLDVDKVAVMGYSCGGLMSINAGKDMRLSTVVLMNSGLTSPNQNTYSSLHTPIAYFNGGSGDIAYENGNRDYDNIKAVPVYLANLPVGHGGTYSQDNGGEFARVGVSWLNWWLKDDLGATGKGKFIGTNCGICGTNWVIKQKGF